MMLMKSVHHPNRISHAEHNWSQTRSTSTHKRRLEICFHDLPHPGPLPKERESPSLRIRVHQCLSVVEFSAAHRFKARAAVLEDYAASFRNRFAISGPLPSSSCLKKMNASRHSCSCTRFAHAFSSASP